MLSLKEAIENKQLSEFIRQEEARGIGPAESEKAFTKALSKIVKQPQSEDQTSHSPSGGDLRGR